MFNCLPLCHPRASSHTHTHTCTQRKHPFFLTSHTYRCALKILCTVCKLSTDVIWKQQMKQSWWWILVQQIWPETLYSVFFMTNTHSKHSFCLMASGLLLTSWSKESMSISTDTDLRTAEASRTGSDLEGSYTTTPVCLSKQDTDVLMILMSQ